MTQFGEAMPGLTILQVKILKLKNLSGCTVEILQILRKSRAATLGQLAKALPAYRSRCISGALNRLEAYGFVDKPEQMNGPWEITAAGLALFETKPAAAVPVLAVGQSEEPDIAETPPIEGMNQPDDLQVPPEQSEVELNESPPFNGTGDFIQAMEIEVALDEVRNRLRAPLIPARAQRVYREILNQLPPALVSALEPVTALIKRTYELR